MNGEQFTTGPEPTNDAERTDVSEQPPLSHVKENAERIPLYEDIHTALHNIRTKRIQQGDADTQEMQAIKDLTDAGTSELLLPRMPREEAERELTPSEQEQQARTERRKEEYKQRTQPIEIVRDAARRIGKTRPGPRRSR